MDAIDGSVRGLWFGLADLVGEDGAARHTMYGAATRSFDPDDGGDWACDCMWQPSDRYIHLDGLAAIELDDWVAALDHAVAVVIAVRPWETAPSGLQGVGVGFDDGDVSVVWTNTASL